MVMCVHWVGTVSARGHREGSQSQPPGPCHLLMQCVWLESALLPVDGHARLPPTPRHSPDFPGVAQQRS